MAAFLGCGLAEFQEPKPNQLPQPKRVPGQDKAPPVSNKYTSESPSPQSCGTTAGSARCSNHGQPTHLMDQGARSTSCCGHRRRSPASRGRMLPSRSTKPISTQYSVHCGSSRRASAWACGRRRQLEHTPEPEAELWLVESQPGQRIKTVDDLLASAHVDLSRSGRSSGTSSTSGTMPSKDMRMTRRSWSSCTRSRSGSSASTSWRWQ
jgi:hypothetical protein